MTLKVSLAPSRRKLRRLMSAKLVKYRLSPMPQSNLA